MYSVEYTVSPANTTDKLNAKYVTGSYYYLPIINSSSGGGKTPNDENIEVTLLDGSVVMGSNVAVSTIKSIKVYYAENSKGIRFIGTDGNPHRISSLINVDIQGFTSMERMFCCCPYLTEVNTSNWDVSKITVFGYMFYMCTSIKCLDLSSFKTRSSSSSSYNMFDGWTSSQVVYISNDWTLDISSFDATFINLSTVKKIAVYTFDNTVSADCPIYLRSSESGTSLFYYFQTVDTIDGNITHRTIFVSNDVVITRMQINNQPSLLTVEYMRIDENITYCGALVFNAKNLTYINTDNWDTKNVKDMSSMFSGCESLTDLNLSHLDMSQVEYMAMMFWNCKSLQNLNVTGWDTSKVTSMHGMFGFCTMTALDISSFDTSSVTDYDSMFSDFSSSQKVYVGKKWTLGTSGFGATIIVTNIFTYTLAKYTFNRSVADCLPNITGATTSQWGYSDKVDGNITIRTIGTDDANVKPTAYNFNDKKSLLSIDYIKIDSNVTSLYRLVRNCTSVTYVNTQGWDVSNVTTCDSMCSGASALPSIDLSNLNFTKPVNFQYMFQNCTNLIEVKTTNFKASPTSMLSMFQYCSSLTSLDLSNWNVGAVTNMNAMFRGCSSLTTLDLSNWKVDSVTNMANMFYSCSKLTTLNLSNWNVGAVTNMSSMFYSCSSLTSLNTSTWNTSKVTNMNAMFSGCAKLKTLDLSHFNVETVTDVINMFNGCSALTTLDLSSWNASKVTSMSGMFQGCSSLTTLDLSNWDTSAVFNMNNMFSSCSSLTLLDISNFDTSKVSTWGSFGANKLTNIGLVYASSTTINSIVTNWLKTSVARNVYYMDAEPSELTTQTNITYVQYRQSALSCSEEITLRSNGDVYDELDLLTGQVIQRIGEDNEILEEEIVRTIELNGEISFYENSYIYTSSNEITPKFEFQPTLTNCYVVSDLKPNTQYTVLFEGNPTLMSLGGTTIENPISKTVIISGEVDNILWFDTSVSKIMILEGDLINRDVEYFTGVKSSQKIQVQLRGEGSPIFGEGGRR